MAKTSVPRRPQVDDLASLDVPDSIKIQKIGFWSRAGVMEKVTFVVPFPELADKFTFERLLTRNDFDLDSNAMAGQRDITESHVKKIADGIQSTDRPYLGTLTVALPRNQVVIDVLKEIAEHIALVRLTIPDSAENPVIEDGQHRVKMANRVWPIVKDAIDGDHKVVRDYLEQTSVEITLLLEGDPDTLSTIFVRMGSTKPISPSLIAVMDKSNYQNRLGQHVIRHSRLLHNRVTYLSTTASKAMATKKGTTFEALYPAAAVRSAAASIAGVGVRDRTPEQREAILRTIIDDRARQAGISAEAIIEIVGNEVVALLDYAYDTLPGWRDLSRGMLSVAEFKKQYVHAAAAGLHVIGNTIAAARMAGLSPQRVIDAMAKLPWKRNDLKDAVDDRGEQVKVHELFEGSLAVTAFDVKTGAWRAGTGGATRTTYENAIDRVLRQLALKHRPLKALGERSTFLSLGLTSDVRRGRPRKVVTRAG